MIKKTKFLSLSTTTSIHSSPKSRGLQLPETRTLSSALAVSQLLSCFLEMSDDTQTEMCKHIQGNTFPKQQTRTGNMAASVIINQD